MANIRLSKKNKTIKIVNRKDNIRLSRQQNKITLKHTGERGPRGITGEGMPEGGQDGYVLVKDGNDSYDSRWAEPSELADKNHITNFTISNEVNVNHNLNKYPAVSVIDSAGDEVIGEVYYLNTTQLVVSFANPFSGKITCN